MSSDETRDHNALSAAITASSTSMYAFGAAALALAERALRWDANFLDARPPRRRLDRLHQLGHLDFGQAPPDSEKSPPSLEARLSWPGDE